MSNKIYSSSQNGNITFADPLAVGNKLYFPVARQRNNRFGTTVTRSIKSNFMFTLLPNKECTDACNMAPYGEYIETTISNLVPRDATEKTAFIARLEAHFADVLRAVTEHNWASGFQPSADAVFNGTKPSE